MAISQKKSPKKHTGGSYKRLKGKKLSELGNKPTLSKIGDKKRVFERITGGGRKYRILLTTEINLIDPKTKKAVKGTMKTAVDNPANRHYVRRNVLTKGTIVDTDKGKARITNRPGQEGAVNGVLIA